MKACIFREYDIRGVVGDELPIDNVYDLARAIVHYYLEKKPGLTSLIVGMDGRLHSKAIKEHVIAAINDLGITVIDIGVCPTPAFYFAVHTLSTTSGIMITASHNPSQYNGFKLCLEKRTVWGKQVQEIRRLYESLSVTYPSYNSYKKDSELHTSSSSTGEKYIHYHDINLDYISWLTKHFGHLKGLALNAVIDCGNGTACTILPDLVNSMHWKNVTLLCEHLDGSFPNHTADPTVIHNMLEVKEVLAQNSTINLGIGFDGDCDRMDAMCKDGYLIPGDQLLAIFSRSILEKYPQAGIVYDVKSSQSLIQLLKTWDARGHISPCGHSIIKETMMEHGAILGGELSCHFFFHDRYFGYDDGIYAALRLLEIIHFSGKSLEDLLAELPTQVSSPEVRIPCSEENKKEIVAYVKAAFDSKHNMELITIDGVRVQTPYGWGLIRASNTQAELSLRFESTTIAGLHKIKTDFSLVLEKYFQPALLKEKIDF